MRIVIATPFYPPQAGVLGTYAEGLETAFKAIGHEPVVVTFGKQPPGIRHLVYFLRVLRAAWGAGFVLALDTWSVGMPAFWAARLRGVPFLVRLGGDFLWETYVARTNEARRLSDFYTDIPSLSFKERLIFHATRLLAGGARRLLFTTRFQREIWRAAYGFKTESAAIVENRFPPAIGTYLPATGLTLVSAGRDIALKNREMLERVIARLADTHPGLTLDMRPLPREEHLQRVARSYAVVIASYSEVCSNTAIDAVSLGKPFIMTEDTGTKERLAECGLFIDTRSEAAMEQAILSLLDPQTYERLAANARTFAFTHSWEDIAKEILAAV